MSAAKAFGSDAVVDSFIQEILDKVLQLGYSEILLPPTSNDFSEKKLGITRSGRLILTNGKFRGLNTIHRVGETELIVSESANLEMVFTVDLGLSNPTTSHDFFLVLWKREMEGVVNLAMSHVKFKVVLGLNLYTRRLRLIQLKCKELGHTETNIKGLGTVMDYFVTKVTNIIVNRIKWDIAAEVEVELQRYMTEIIDNTGWPSPKTPNFVINK